MSCLTTGLAALLDALQSDDTLTDVNILGRKPRGAEDVQSASGEQAAVFVDNIEIDREVVTMRAGVIEYEETVTFTLISQVLEDVVEDPFAVLQRCEEIADAAIGVQQNNATLDVTTFRRFEATVNGSDVKYGALPNGGWGARREDEWQFVARIDAP
jgi:hypothetical protein